MITHKMFKRDILEKYGSQIKSLGVNITGVAKNDLLKIVNFRCKHKHSAFTHPRCYKEAPDNMIERIGYFDIETSQLKANFGIILSWCIKDKDGDMYQDQLTPKDIRKGIQDRRIVESAIECIKGFDRIVTQFGTYFDLPFLRTRALHWGLMFPPFGEIYHTDIWKIAKRKLCLHSNRQGSIAETVLGHSIKTRIRPDIWLAIQFGSKEEKKKAMDYLVEHNEKDVIQLGEIHLRIRKFIKEGRTSI